MESSPVYRLGPAAEATLSKAVVRAAGLLGFNQAALAGILGISRATVSRLFAGRYLLDPKRPKEWELALLFVRLYRSLDALVGHGAQGRTWLHGPNDAFGRPPVEEITTAEGLVRVVQYLDAARGRV